MTFVNQTKEEFQKLVASAKLTLAETFDPQTRVAKDFTEILQFHKKQFPDFPLASPPKEMDIAILSFNDLAPHRTFLGMLQQAIKLKFKKEIKIVSGSEWESARFLIAPDYGIAGDPHLSKNMREGERPGQNFLGQTPLFLLTDLSLYMKEPKLKSALWRALCQELALLK